jgi:hypothetical protein
MVYILSSLIYVGFIYNQYRKDSITLTKASDREAL